MKSYVTTAIILMYAVGLGAVDRARAAPKLVIPPPAQVLPLALDAKPQRLKLERAIIRMNEGHVWAHEADELFCGASGGTEVRWRAERAELKLERLSAVFEEELTRAQFQGVASESLFDEGRPIDGLQVGAVITDIRARICNGVFSDGYREKVGMVLEIEWQIYDPLERTVVGRVRTRAGAQEKRYSKDGVGLALTGAFRESSRALLADPALRAFAVKGVRSAPTSPAMASRAPIRLVAPVPIAGRKLSDVAGSVAAVMTGGGHGSAFLISSDGYLITNDHVVGDSKYVKVRWSDNTESLGEVVRTDRRRDVALIKAEARGRVPLALRQTSVTAGETVFAIGTPLDEKLQNTLTSGIVSAAERSFDGQTFIQSDVAVTHGNSGGPLIDEKGQVIGLTVSGREINGAPMGLNFFVPISDALRVLNLQPGA